MTPAHELRGSMESRTHDWAIPVYEAWDAEWPGVPPFSPNPWLYPHEWRRVRLLPRSADSGPSSPQQDKQVVERMRAVLSFVVGQQSAPEFLVVARSSTYVNRTTPPRKPDPLFGPLRRLLPDARRARDARDLFESEGYTSWEHDWHSALSLDTVSDSLLLGLANTEGTVIASPDLTCIVAIGGDELDVILTSSSARASFDVRFAKWFSGRREWIWPRP